jgi:hypothetical protein
MTTLLRGIAIFFLLIVATSVMRDIFKLEFGDINFWQKHGVFFLFFITLFPRLTLLFSSVAFGGFFWWLGFFFLPRILIASLATVAYFKTNPLLVTISWLIALGGEVFEKWGLSGRKKFVFRTFRTADYEAPVYKDKTLNHGDVIEAEFTKK